MTTLKEHTDELHRQAWQQAQTRPSPARFLADRIIIENYRRQGIKVSEWPFAGYWQAVRDDYEPPMPVGQGMTPAAAAADLIEKEAE